MIHVELVNSGSKTITAYELELGYGFDDPVIEDLFISIDLDSEFPAPLSRERQNFAGGILGQQETLRLSSSGLRQRVARGGRSDGTVQVVWPFLD